MLRRPVLSFFVLAFAITWGLGASFALFPGPLEALFGKASFANPLALIAVYAPTIAALVLSFAENGLRGAVALVGRLFRVRFGLRWYAVILLLYPAIVVTGRLLAWAISGSAPSMAWWQMPFGGLDGEIMLRRLHSEGWASLPLIVGLMLLQDPGPLGEELGWRGFALPRMIKDRNWVAMSVLLGIIWGIWHLPAFFISGLPQNVLSLPLFLVTVVAASVLAAWVFIGTKGSVLATVVMHFMTNTCIDPTHFPAAYYIAGVLVAAAVLVAVLGRDMDTRAAARV